MPSAREIRVRMNSIQQTRKITNAMYLISSAKLRKAKQEWDQTRPYFQALKAEVKRIFRTSGHVESRDLYPDEGELPPNGTYGFLVITADKGLAGAYNQNVLKEAHRLMQEHPQTKLFVVGEYGRQYFQRHQVPIERSFLYTAQNPTMQRAREITAELLDRFDKGELQKIMKNSLTENVSATRILPFHRSAFTAPTDEKRITEPFEFFPSVTQVLENIVPSYVSGFIYSALIDSFCSEQSARMNAMNSANENAEKMLGELALAYNRIRQAAITQEITEVSAGARAQKRKRQKQHAQGRES